MSIFKRKGDKKLNMHLDRFVESYFQILKCPHFPLQVVCCLIICADSSWFEFKFSLGTKENWICTGKKC